MAFPRKLVEINALLQLWKDRFPTHQAGYGLTSEQIRQVSDDADVYNHLLTVRNQLDEDVGEFVADPTTSPYIDATTSTGGNPEKRENRAIYLEKNQPVGQYSDIITIYTTP